MIALIRKCPKKGKLTAVSFFKEQGEVINHLKNGDILVFDEVPEFTATAMYLEDELMFHHHGGTSEVMKWANDQLRLGNYKKV